MGVTEKKEKETLHRKGSWWPGSGARSGSTSRGLAAALGAGLGASARASRRASGDKSCREMEIRDFT